MTKEEVQAYHYFDGIVRVKSMEETQLKGGGQS